MTEVSLLGVVTTLSVLVALILVWRGHGRGPLVAVLAGTLIAVVFAASHLLPHWSAFSDPYADVAPDAASWTLVLLEITIAGAVAMLGLTRLQWERRAAPERMPPTSRP